MYVSFNRMWYNKKQAVKKTGRGSYRKWKGKKMKKKLIAVIAGVFLMGSLTGCSSQLSNEYITIKQYKGLEVPQVEATELTDDQVTNYVNYFSAGRCNQNRGDRPCSADRGYSQY